MQAVKSFFDFIKRIQKFNVRQNKQFWDSLDEREVKKYSQYMVNRYVSMAPEFIDIANDFQKYKVSDKHHFLFFSEVIPKNNIYLRYVKRKKTMDWPKLFLEVVAKHFEVSLREAQDACEMYMISPGGKLELREILNRYGIQDKEISKVYDYES